MARAWAPNAVLLVSLSLTLRSGGTTRATDHAVARTAGRPTTMRQKRQWPHLAADAWQMRVEQPPHPLEELADTPPPQEDKENQPPLGEPYAELLEHRLDGSTGGRPFGAKPAAAGHLQPRVETHPVLRPFHKPVRHCDIFVDDFILVNQGTRKSRKNHRRGLLHALDHILRPLDSADSPHRNHAASVKKLLKGDACLITRKVLLGWIVDTLLGTLELPPHSIQRLLDIFEYLRS